MNEKFGDYNLLRLLGAGQKTKVYLAEHPANGRLALKFTDEVVSPEWSNLFLTGVRKASALTHPNITQIHDWGTTDGRVFEASDFILGRDLQNVAARGFTEGRFLPIPMAVSVIASAAGGLHYAHTRRDSEGGATAVIHENLCPQNIILGADGTVRLTDFAIGEATRALSPSPDRLGYLSPEQIDDDYGEIDVRTDVFSLGVVAYELISCKRLFKGDTTQDVYKKVLTMPIMAPHHVRADVDADLSAIIMKALEREPTLRFESIRDFQMSLVDWLSSQDNHTTDAHLSTYLNSLFPELVGEKVPEETNALVISASLFEQMDASSGANFEKWIEEQAMGQQPQMDEPTPIESVNDSFEEEKTSISLEATREAVRVDAVAKPQISNELGAVSIPAMQPKSPEDFVPVNISEPEPPAEEAAPKKKRIALADLPMPSLSLAQSSIVVSPPAAQTASGDDFETDDEDSDPEDDKTVSMSVEEMRMPQPNDLPQSAPGVVSDHTASFDPQPSAPGFIAQPSTPQSSPVGSEKILDTNPAPAGPVGFRPPAFTPPHGIPASGPAPSAHIAESDQAPLTTHNTAAVSTENEIEDWKPTSSKKGILIGILSLLALCLLGGGMYLAMNAESTLEEDVGGKKIDPSQLKELVIDPPPPTQILAVSSTNENVHYIVNGKLKNVTDGGIPIFKGITNEVVAMAPGHAPKMEMVAGEAGIAPLSFELVPLESEPDTELQIMTDPRGASIIVDGVEAGTSPTTIKLSSKIEHHVEISASGRRPHGAFIGLVPGQENLIDVQLESEKRSYVGVNFGALPRGATIKLDGKPFAMSPTFKKLKRNRIMRVDMSHIDAFPSTRRVSLVDFGSFEMRPFLKKISRKKGTISLKVTPKGGEIYIGANGYGVGPVKRLKLTEGSKLVIIDSAAGRVEKKIDVIPGKHVSYTLKLNGKNGTLTKKILKK